MEGRGLSRRHGGLLGKLAWGAGRGEEERVAWGRGFLGPRTQIGRRQSEVSGGACLRQGVSFLMGGAVPSRGRRGVPWAWLTIRLRPWSPALSSAVLWSEKSGSRWVEEVARLQAVTAGNHDCSGSKVPSTDTQRVSDRAGPGEDLQRPYWPEREIRAPEATDKLGCWFSIRVF